VTDLARAVSCPSLKRVCNARAPRICWVVSNGALYNPKISLVPPYRGVSDHYSRTVSIGICQHPFEEQRAMEMGYR
jgi:hypothetical protein